MFLKYCPIHQQLFPSISLLHPADIQRLMGCLAFCHRGLQNSPYKDLMAPWLWTDVAENFTKDACMLMGLGLESPLSIRWALWCIVHYHASTLCMYVRCSHTQHTHTHTAHTHTHTHCVSLSPCSLPLPTSLSAGCMALPILLQVHNVMEQQQISDIINHKGELPVSLCCATTNCAPTL